MKELYYKKLTDEEVDFFRRSPGSFDDMVRAIHESGWRAGYARQKREFRECTRCKQVKTVEEFNRNVSGSLQKSCAACIEGMQMYNKYRVRNNVNKKADIATAN